MTVRKAVIGLLLAHTGLLAWSAYRHSPAGDEIAHLPAGISHWRFGRFDLYCVNPPLVRMVAALPVLCVNPEIDWSQYSSSPTNRAEFAIGRELVHQHGMRSLWWFTLARWACIPFSLLGAYVCCRWATELYGIESGLLVLALWCFSPNILAYGQMITPDMGAASVGVAACYLFLRWTRSEKWSDAIVVGAVLGLAELTKLTWAILFALWPLLWIGSRWWNREKRPIVRPAIQISAMVLIAVYVINVGYGFEGTFRRLGEYEFLSRSLSGRHDRRSVEAGNRFRDTFLSVVPVPLPANYVQGIDVAKRDFERGLPSYLRGEWKHGGWWYYYLYALCVKVPIGTFGLAACAIWMRCRSGRRMPAMDCLLLSGVCVSVITLVSSQTGYNHHLRYIFPAFPFALVLIGSAGQCWQPGGSRLMRGLVATCIGATITSSLLVYPHSLSYFNELAGGPANGHAHLLDSNIDWGQDLIYLKEWLDHHPDAVPIGMACYTQADPQSFGIDYWLPVKQIRSTMDDQMHEGEQKQEFSGELKPGWYAISANYLRGMTRIPLPDESGRRIWSGRLHFTQFLRLKPAARIGYSIYLYHVDSEEVEERGGALSRMKTITQ